MNKYVESVINTVKVKHVNEPEFVQTVEEVLTSISPVMDAHPEYEKAAKTLRKENLYLAKVDATQEKKLAEKKQIIVATKIDSNIRELEGVFNKIVARASLTHSPITIELAENVINTHIDRYKAQIIEEDRKNREREKRQKEYDEKRQSQETISQDIPPAPPVPSSPHPELPEAVQSANALATQDKALQKCEYDVIKCIVKTNYLLRRILN